MTEGTKSYLIGCHQFFLHPILVIMAWRLEYKSWPLLWQIICIFLHDIGICGRQYLTDDKAKHGHWVQGAIIAGKSLRYLVKGRRFYLYHKAYQFIAGHTQESGYAESLLARADKRSWLVAPLWWMWWNYWVEGFGNIPPPEWKKIVAENLRREKLIDSHVLYIQNRK